MNKRRKIVITVSALVFIAVAGTAAMTLLSNDNTTSKQVTRSGTAYHWSQTDPTLSSTVAVSIDGVYKQRLLPWAKRSRRDSFDGVIDIEGVTDAKTSQISAKSVNNPATDYARMRID